MATRKYRPTAKKLLARFRKFYDYADLSYDELADMLDSSSSNIHQWLTKAQTLTHKNEVKLREFLDLMEDMVKRAEPVAPATPTTTEIEQWRSKLISPNYKAENEVLKRRVAELEAVVAMYRAGGVQ